MNCCSSLEGIPSFLEHLNSMAKGIPQGKTIFAQRIFFLCRCSIGLIDFKKQQRKNGILLSNYISTQKKVCWYFIFKRGWKNMLAGGANSKTKSLFGGIWPHFNKNSFSRNFPIKSQNKNKNVIDKQAEGFSKDTNWNYCLNITC